jgi:hypothetical protein
MNHGSANGSQKTMVKAANNNIYRIIARNNMRNL